MPGPYATVKTSCPARAGTVPLLLLGAGLLLFAVTLLDAAWRGNDNGLASSLALVAELGLTDLALFTEARYTRHLSQADRHTAFQDHPLALDHFPSGSLVPPPQRLQQP
ncbi:hypothetical protein [Sulfurivermis fontis]|uniref:hypothetical protein n=1 Tax=Sulfurivermis fontis TaxID=1972068 RepID=UPI001E4791C9|nr:hypothetical protein [Sulfurivermis fontis]